MTKYLSLSLIRLSMSRREASRLVVPVPTHVFCVVTRCLSSEVVVHQCPAEQLDVAAFLLPHLPRPENCQPWAQYLVQHSATVSDVELLTGLRLFEKLPRYEAIRLRTLLPEGLWPAA